MCSPRLLEGLLTKSEDRHFASRAHNRIWDQEGELDVEGLRGAANKGGHSRGFVAKVVADKLCTRERASAFGIIDDGNCSVHT